MKKFINRPEDVVEEMLQGLVLLHTSLARLAGHKVVVRAGGRSGATDQVAILSGGGSGHEPAHAGYIGEGMLSAAVLGEVFTSPSSDSVFAAIKAVAGQGGALLVVKNYTGDRLNFGLAAEMARSEGIPTELVIVDDDVALKGKAQATGARGLAGTVFVHKILGAAATEGRSLTDLTALGKAVAASLATMGASFSAGVSPAVGRPSFELGEHEMEVGLGIHGEPGVQRADILPADKLAERLLREILAHGQLGTEKRLAVMVNNLGATTEMELAIIVRAVISFLEGNGYLVERIYAGTFLSSLDMAGISISVLGVNDEWMHWLDADTTAPAWPRGAKQRPTKQVEVVGKIGSDQSKPLPAVGTGGNTRLAIEAACQALIKAEGELTELDRITGDGDLGTNMARAAKTILASVSSYPLDSVSATLKALGHSLRQELGGSSGPLYGIFFLRCGTVLEKSNAIDVGHWAAALRQGCAAISELGGAKPGDRTMLDALDPFVKALDKGEGTAQSRFATAVNAGEQGAEATAQMQPRMGRSSYLGDRVLGHVDPGAKAVAIWLRAVAGALGA